MHIFNTLSRTRIYMLCITSRKKGEGDWIHHNFFYGVKRESALYSSSQESARTRSKDSYTRLILWSLHHHYWIFFLFFSFWILPLSSLLSLFFFNWQDHGMEFEKHIDLTMFSFLNAISPRRAWITFTFEDFFPSLSPSQLLSSLFSRSVPHQRKARFSLLLSPSQLDAHSRCHLTQRIIIMNGKRASDSNRHSRNLSVTFRWSVRLIVNFYTPEFMLFMSMHQSTTRFFSHFFFLPSGFSRHGSIIIDNMREWTREKGARENIIFNEWSDRKKSIEKEM